MPSRTVITSNTNPRGSRLVTAIQMLNEKFDNEIKGQFRPVALISCGKAAINSEGIDVEFDIDFDDDLEANEMHLTMYNLTKQTVNQFGFKDKVTVTAGYGDDTGIIFEGYIKTKKTTHSGGDMVTEILAVDDPKRQGQEVIVNVKINLTFTINKIINIALHIHSLRSFRANRQIVNEKNFFRLL